MRVYHPDKGQGLEGRVDLLIIRALEVYRNLMSGWDVFRDWQSNCRGRWRRKANVGFKFCVPVAGRKSVDVIPPEPRRHGPKFLCRVDGTLCSAVQRHRRPSAHINRKPQTNSPSSYIHNYRHVYISLPIIPSRIHPPLPKILLLSRPTLFLSLLPGLHNPQQPPFHIPIIHCALTFLAHRSRAISTATAQIFVSEPGSRISPAYNPCSATSASRAASNDVFTEEVKTATMMSCGWRNPV